MKARIDDRALAELIRQLGQRNDENAAQLLVALDELRERRAQSSEVELRARQTALMRLTRSEALGSGDLEVALREITELAAETLGVARSSVWRYNHDHSAIVCHELYRRDEQIHEAGIELQQADFPSYFEAIRNNRIIAAHDAHRHPATREFSEPYLAPLGITSMLDAPIRVGGRMIGVICNEHVGEPRRWSTADEQFGAALGDVVALAFESAERKRTADELRSTVALAEQRLETIERQGLAIANLSAPVIDIWEGILVLPVIGLVDNRRSIELTERLLNRIVDAGAESVIVDLTGVDVVDTMTANHILQMLRAASLLGAFSVLSGISPQIAQTLVQLDVALTEITTVRNLEEALKTCLRRTTLQQAMSSSKAGLVQRRRHR
jgi:rsbT co-antagonist protein RsbR